MDLQIQISSGLARELLEQLREIESAEVDFDDSRLEVRASLGSFRLRAIEHVSLRLKEGRVTLSARVHAKQIGRLVPKKEKLLRRIASPLMYWFAKGGEVKNVEVTCEDVEWNHQGFGCTVTQPLGLEWYARALAGLIPNPVVESLCQGGRVQIDMEDLEQLRSKAAEGAHGLLQPILSRPLHQIRLSPEPGRLSIRLASTS